MSMDDHLFKSGDCGKIVLKSALYDIKSEARKLYRRSQRSLLANNMSPTWAPLNYGQLW
jgi:hypothetical protein